MQFSFGSKASDHHDSACNSRHAVTHISLSTLMSFVPDSMPRSLNISTASLLWIAKTTIAEQCSRRVFSPRGCQMLLFSSIDVLHSHEDALKGHGALQMARHVHLLLQCRKPAPHYRMRAMYGCPAQHHDGQGMALEQGRRPETRRSPCPLISMSRLVAVLLGLGKPAEDSAQREHKASVADLRAAEQELGAGIDSVAAAVGIISFSSAKAGTTPHFSH